MRRVHLSVLVAAIAMTLALAGTGAASGAKKGPSCTTSGATWKWRALKGNEYKVYSSGTTCTFARLWSARLSYERLLGKYGAHTILGGPKGWTCGFPYPFPFTNAWAGACRKGKAVFTWLPRLPKSAIGP
jgi:hypothetical protein